MQVYLSCCECQDETTYPSFLVEDGIYHLTCSKGHETTVSIQQMKFEQLYNIAANALIDGYYREAVSTISAAVERFYEFYIEFVMTKNKQRDVHRAAWAKIRNQSERQLGAYIFLYSLENGEMPVLLSESEVGFRNKVIHKGVFPTQEDTLEYCEAATQVILSALIPIKEKEREVYQEVFRVAMQKIYDNCEFKGTLKVVLPPSALEMREQKMELDFIIQVLAKMRRMKTI